MRLEYLIVGHKVEHIVSAAAKEHALSQRGRLTHLVSEPRGAAGAGGAVSLEHGEREVVEDRGRQPAHLSVPAGEREKCERDVRERSERERDREREEGERGRGGAGACVSRRRARALREEQAAGHVHGDDVRVRVGVTHEDLVVDNRQVRYRIRKPYAIGGGLLRGDLVGAGSWQDWQEKGKNRHLLIVAHGGRALGGVFEQGSDLFEGGSGVREGRRAGGLRECEKGSDLLGAAHDAAAVEELGHAAVQPWTPPPLSPLACRMGVWM